MIDYIKVKPGEPNEILISDGNCNPFWVIVTSDNEVVFKRSVYEEKEKP